MSVSGSVDRRSVFWTAGSGWRFEHSVWLSRETGRIAARAVPCSGHADDAQILGYLGPGGGTDADDHVHEEPLDDWWRIVDHAVRRRNVQPGRPELALSGEFPTHLGQDVIAKHPTTAPGEGDGNSTSNLST